jgi:hypothetical protein
MKTLKENYQISPAKTTVDAETFYVLSPIYKDVIQQALELKGTVLFISVSHTCESNSHAEKAKYLINKSWSILIITCIKICTY